MADPLSLLTKGQEAEDRHNCSRPPVPVSWRLAVFPERIEFNLRILK